MKKLLKRLMIAWELSGRIRLMLNGATQNEEVWLALPVAKGKELCRFVRMY